MINKKNIFMLFLLFVLILSFISGCAEKETEGLEYATLEDGTYYVSDYNGNSTKVYIPAKHNDIKITAIGEEAFAESDIQSISGGEILKIIEENAFENCYMLKSVELDDDITNIYSDAFSGCTNLKEFKIPSNVEIIEWGVFSGCTSLKSVTVPDGVTEIDCYAFLDCTSLESVKLPDSLIYISTQAFKNCESLSQINLPDGLKVIGEEAFYNCSSLKMITIPATVTKIEEKAFNTSMDITVEGNVEGWSGSWCGMSASVNYLGRESAVPDAEIKYGTYACYIESEINGKTDIFVQYIYIDENELSHIYESGFHLCGTKYSYGIVGNRIYGKPKKGEYSNIEIIYDEDNESMQLGTDMYLWQSSEMIDESIIYM